MYRRELELIHTVTKELRSELIEAYVEDNKYLDFVVSALKGLNDS